MAAIDGGFDEHYRALASRDARFDGRFVAGVHTTGIYCRPSCPAVTPKPTSVRFYRTPAAAQEAGLRACKRCQPDAVPGLAGWDLRGETAATAVRLIEAGVVDREGVGGLAARVGYSERQLHRILVDELGAGPLALARARRAQAARALLLGTGLPVADVAFAAGFGSVRQCHDTVREVYGVAPSALRSSRAAECGPAAAHRGTTITVRLATSPPFDGEAVLAYLADHAVEGIERVDGGVYDRRLRLAGGDARLRAWLDDERLGEHDVDAEDGPAAPPMATGVAASMELADLADLEATVAAVRGIFDLDADADAIDRALAADARLAPIVAAHPGARIPGSPDPAETLVRTMVGQQVSIAGARTLLSRLVAALGDGRFPDPATIAERGAEVLVGPAARVAALRGAMARVADGSLDLVAPDPETLMARLVAEPGIGPWTAGYVAIRSMRAPDVLLAGDLVMLHAARDLGIAEHARGLAAAGAAWAPWRSYAGLRLWRARSAARPSDRTGTLTPGGGRA